MDIWERLYEAARTQYRPAAVSPFLYARHVVCALESGNGEICRICVGIGGKVRFFLKYCFSDGIIPQNC